MPVFFFAMAELTHIGNDSRMDLVLLFVLLHVLVYPSSNAYNSLQDRDEGSIGLIRKPLPVPASLHSIVNVFDAMAILLALLINLHVTIMVMVYILFSRLYSYRGIRLKQYAIPGFLTVFIFQGGWIFMMVQAISPDFDFRSSLPMAIVSSCLIGAIYPLSQIYQHQQDQADGVNSLSALLGYRGTFLFSGVLFITGTVLFTRWQFAHDEHMKVWILLACQGPVVSYFVYWFLKVWHDPGEASFEHTMRMNSIAAICMNLCFIILNFFR